MLPNGNTVTTKPVTWKNLKLALWVTSLTPNQDYPGIVGNNANIISHEDVSTSAGLATLVHFERTPPAAASGTGSTPINEFYVISYGRKYAYVIQATVTGNASAAKSELMSLLQGWNIPFQGVKLSSPNPELTQWRYNSGIGQQISQSLNGKSFKSFYLPVFITKGDSFVAVESNNSAVTIRFKDMTLMQSPNPTRPSGTVEKSTVVTVPNLFPGTTVTVYTMADKSLALAMKVPFGTHILLSSPSIPLSQLEAILQHMSPLNG